MVHRWMPALIVVPLAMLAIGPHGPTPLALATAVTSATAQSGGVQLSLRISDGPYFLSELLPVTISLVNHSGAAIRYGGDPRQALGAVTQGGTKPYYPPVEVTLSGGTGTSAQGGTLADG